MGGYFEGGGVNSPAEMLFMRILDFSYTFECQTTDGDEKWSFERNVGNEILVKFQELMI